jgi:hypothetical protein
MKNVFADYATYCTVHGLNPGRDERFFYFPKRLDRVTPSHPPTSCSVGTVLCYPGINRPGGEVNHSPPSSAELKNEWSCTSATGAAAVPSWRGQGQLYRLTSSRLKVTCGGKTAKGILVDKYSGKWQRNYTDCYFFKSLCQLRTLVRDCFDATVANGVLL